MKTRKIKLNKHSTFLQDGANLKKLNERFPLRVHVEISEIPEEVTDSELLLLVDKALLFNPPQTIPFSALKEKAEAGILMREK